MDDPRVDELYQRALAGKINRRQILRRAATLGLSMPVVAALLAACGAEETPTTSGGAATATRRAGTATATTRASSSPQAGGGSGDKGVIRFYSSWPMTGASQKVGQDSARAVEMAIKDWGGVAGGYTIEYEALDDATAQAGTWDAGKEAENANRALNDADCMAYIGTYNSGAAAISIPILNEVGLLMISPANTWPGLTKTIEGLIEEGEPDIYYPSGQRNYCRVVPTDEIQGGVSAQWAQSQGVQRVYVLDDTQLYGHGVAMAFVQEAERLGIEVLGQEGIDYRASDYRALMNNIRSQNPDMIYFGGLTDTNAGKLVQDMRAVGMTDVIFMGPDGIFNSGFIEAGGQAAEETYATFGGLPPQELTGKGADWYQNFVDTYGEDPDPYAVYAYEAATVVLTAIEQVGEKDRDAIREAVLATRDFEGLLGTWSFTETGDTTLTTMSLNQVMDGEWGHVQTLELQES